MTVRSAHVSTTVFAIDQRTGATSDFSGSGYETFIDGKAASLSWSIRSGKQRGQIVVAGGGLYVRDDKASNAARPWVKIDLASGRIQSSVRPLVVGFEALVTLGSPDYAAGLRPAASEVRVRLPATVQGVRSTDYPMFIDPTKVKFGASVLRQLTQPVAMTADVFLDDANRVFILHQQQNDGPTDFESQSTYTKYNATVVIKAPIADRVAN